MRKDAWKVRGERHAASRHANDATQREALRGSIKRMSPIISQAPFFDDAAVFLRLILIEQLVLNLALREEWWLISNLRVIFGVTFLGCLNAKSGSGDKIVTNITAEWIKKLFFDDHLLVRVNIITKIMYFFQYSTLLWRLRDLGPILYAHCLATTDCSYVIAATKTRNPFQIF